MRLDIARYLKNKEQMLHYLAQENVMSMKAPPWADHRFESRRNEKAKHGQIGQHLLGKETTALIIELLGIRDDRTCKELREDIQRERRDARYYLSRDEGWIAMTLLDETRLSEMGYVCD